MKISGIGPTNGISGSQKYGADFFNRKSSIFNRKFAKEEIAREGNDHNEAHPVAFFTGTVLDAREIVNPFTNIPFQWASVRTYGGQYDIVADRELLARPLEPGNIVQGEFWLTGRLAEERKN